MLLAVAVSGQPDQVFPMIAFKDVIKSFAESAARVLNKGRDKDTLENLLKDPRWPFGRASMH
jgi:hypothetical protein